MSEIKTKSWSHLVFSLISLPVWSEDAWQRGVKKIKPNFDRNILDDTVWGAVLGDLMLPVSEEILEYSLSDDFIDLDDDYIQQLGKLKITNLLFRSVMKWNWS